ncbi:MAG: DUF1622 domain-containing protein [Phycisphaeraceae bacterium]
MGRAEEIIIRLASWFELTAEALAALMVGIGLTVVIYHAVRTWFTRHQRSYWWTRVQLSQYLVLALEFQLAADILATAIAPSWNELGKLAVVAAIRTALNYFLEREIKAMKPEGAAPDPNRARG